MLCTIELNQTFNQQRYWRKSVMKVDKYLDYGRKYKIDQRNNNYISNRIGIEKYIFFFAFKEGILWQM